MLCYPAGSAQNSWDTILIIENSMSNGLSDILESPEPERLATGFVFTEGPLWYSAGYFLFVDIRTGLTRKLTPGGEAEVVRESSDNVDGITFDLQGRLLMVEMAGRKVSRWEDDGSVTSLFTHWDGKRLNQPNDIICASDGTVYFTDPSITLEDNEKEQSFNGVYCIDPQGTLKPVATDFDFPNGLALSPDERTLYVVNTRPDMHIRAFDRQPDGSLSGDRIFADLTLEGKTGVPDGMKVDVEGRVYCTGPGGVWIFTPSGEHLGTIEMPEFTSNCAWGGPDYQTLFLTGLTTVYSVRAKVPGVKPPGAR